MPFFRSLETAKAVFKIFVNAFNLFARAKKISSPEIRILSLKFYLNARLGHSRLNARLLGPWEVLAKCLQQS